ncbi:MAG: nucleotide-binding protein [Alphaproteobacteria bacterium]
MTNRIYAPMAAVLLTSLVVTANATVDGAEAPRPAAKPAASAEKQATAAQTGKVVEVINASNYTYLRVDTGREKLWLAAPQTKVKAGEKVTFGAGLPMKNFESKALGRKFDTVYFVDQVAREGDKPVARQTSQASGQTLPQGHPKISQDSGAAAKMDFSKIIKASGGKTIAEIYAQKTKLAGKKTAVRGKVVKYNAGIMGKNWIHLKDGTGAEGSNDLAVTTKTDAKVGDTVLVRGNVVTEKDYGYGYKYPVIIEDAEVTVEK